jgi:hypothetical protein
VDVGLVVDAIVNLRMPTNKMTMCTGEEDSMGRGKRFGSVVIAGAGVWMALASAVSLVHEWWGKHSAESICVWTAAMTHPISKALRINGMFPQVSFLLVFVVLPMFRGLARILE